MIDCYTTQDRENYKGHLNKTGEYFKEKKPANNIIRFASTFFKSLGSAEFGLLSDAGLLVLRDLDVTMEAVPHVRHVHVKDLLGEETRLQTSGAGNHL